MPHLSEKVKGLIRSKVLVTDFSDILNKVSTARDVYLFHLPPNRNGKAVTGSPEPFRSLCEFVSKTGKNSTICFLTTPGDAAFLQIELNSIARFQLWVGMKTKKNDLGLTKLPSRHVSLLVVTKYKNSLKHTKSRIGYSYCPACGKTTKDYGGKKHLYHEYGTLVSDVWRDIEIDADKYSEELELRLLDLFGLPEYDTFEYVDLTKCTGLISVDQPVVKEELALFSLANVKPKKIDGLIQGDSLEELRKTRTNSIDFCFADPPYNLKKKYEGYTDSLELQEYFVWCDKWLNELARVVKPGKTVAVLNIPIWAIRHFQFLSGKLQFQNWIIWESMSFPVRMIMPSHYSIICFSKGTPRELPGMGKNLGDPSELRLLKPMAEFYCIRQSCINKRKNAGIEDSSDLTDLWYDIHRLKHNANRVDHPTQLPPNLMRRLISVFTSKDELILDCFNGAGTTTLVAQQMRRRFIGIELSSKYHRIAEKRHQELEKGRDPFGKKDLIPVAKNSVVPRLKKQRYKVSKKVLQLEVKRISRSLQRLPTKEEVKRLGKYPIKYYEEYFTSWGEACAAARTTGMSENPPDSFVVRQQEQLFENV
jgi:site-specific DNA-methyltransferase (adenine-specific)